MKTTLDSYIYQTHDSRLMIDQDSHPRLDSVLHYVPSPEAGLCPTLDFDVLPRVNNVDFL